VIQPISILRSNRNDNPIYPGLTMEGPDGILDHRSVSNRKKDLVDSAPDANAPTTG
jgi:hypothetical protein